MKAAMSIVVELLEPALVRSAEDLKLLDLAQVRHVAIKLTSENNWVDEPLYFESKTDQQAAAIATLVEFARITQPSGTSVEIWYQGRSEAFMF